LENSEVNGLFVALTLSILPAPAAKEPFSCFLSLLFLADYPKIYEIFAHNSLRRALLASLNASPPKTPYRFEILP
jgi:hypothetical protein